MILKSGSAYMRQSFPLVLSVCGDKEKTLPAYAGRVCGYIVGLCRYLKLMAKPPPRAMSRLRTSAEVTCCVLMT